MPLDGSFLALLHPFMEDFTVFRIGLRQISISKALPVIHLRGAIAIPFDDLLDPPFDVAWRPLFATTEILLELNLELADITLEAAQIFICLVCRHGAKEIRC
jgi:hypothetical protein